MAKKKGKGNISCFSTTKNSKKYGTKKGTKVCFFWSKAARKRASDRQKKKK